MTAMESINIYYRPEWTCGRYNEHAQVAIFYNLIDGMCYFFEDESAQVASMFLTQKRKCGITVDRVSASTGIATESIQEFAQTLAGKGLITEHPYTDTEVANYRSLVSKKRISKTKTEVKSTREKLPVLLSTAEMDYTAKVGGITSVMFELTYNCSERCIHCYNIGATRNDNEVSHRGDLVEMTMEDYRRVIDELYELGLVKVCLSGGDPFSKPFVWEIIDYLYQMDIAFDIFTNGQRLVNDVERLANYYPRQIGISIYSSIAETHDLITRVSGSWNKSIQVLEHLSELATPMTVKCCIMQPNVSSYRGVAELAHQNGAPVQYEVNVTDSIEGDKCVSRHLRLSDEQLDIVLRDDDTPMYVGKEAPGYGKMMRNPNEKPCGAGENSFCVTPDGKLIPCCSLHIELGNVKRQSIANIIDSVETLKWWNQLTLDKYEECGKHDYCDYCNLCPGVNFSEHGTPIKAGENNCHLARHRHQLALRLKNDDDPLQGKSVAQKLGELKNIFNTIDLKREQQ